MRPVNQERELMGELTPAEMQRLNSTERDPIEYWERVSDKTLVSQDIIKSVGERADRQQSGSMSPENVPTRWELFGNRQMLLVRDESGKDGGGAMDNEVRKAKQHAQQRESSVFDRVERIGREAPAAERATEKQVPKAKADEETRKASPRVTA